MSFDGIMSALDRRTQRKSEPEKVVEKWLDGTPKEQPRVRDSNGNQFDKARFLADAEYRMNPEVAARPRDLSAAAPDPAAVDTFLKTITAPGVQPAFIH